MFAFHFFSDLYSLQVLLQWLPEARRKDGAAVFITFPLAHDDEVTGKIDVLNPQTETFH